jgi:hypothetical protein
MEEITDEKDLALAAPDRMAPGRLYFIPHAS